MPSFDFAPLVWWGLPAVAAPLLIHLLSRLRHRRVRWAAMEFLLESQRRFRTRVLLRQLLLLALRTAGIAAIVLALAQPRWRQAAGRLLGGGGTHLVVLDDSYSMGDTSGGDDVAMAMTDAAGDTRPRTAFDRGCGVVERIAADLAASGGRHELAVATTSALAAVDTVPPPAFLVPRSVIDPAAVRRVREAVAATRVSARAAGPVAALAAAAATLADDRGERVLWLVSDVRARDWLRADEAVAALERLAASGVTIRLVDCGFEAADPGNLSVERLEVAGGVPAAGVVLPVEIEVRNDGATAARDVTVSLEEDGGGRPGLTIDEIPPGGAAVRRFDVRFTTRGPHALEARLPADVLPADDSRAATVEIVDGVDVLVIDGGAPGDPAGDAFYVATALAPGSGAATGLRPRLEPPRALATLDLAAFDCLWLLDVERLDASAVAAVEAYVRDGGGVVFFCGPRTRPEFVNEVLHRGGAGIFPLPLASAVDLLPDASAATPPPDLVVEDHPVVAVLAGQRNPLVDAVRIERFMAVARGHDPAAAGVRPILSLRTGQPLAVERAFGAGRVAVVLTTAAPAWNNWARGNPSWVVVLLELENLLAARRRQPADVAVGEPLAVRLEPGVDEIDVDFIVPPEGDVVRQAAMAAVGGGLEARLPVTTAAGIHVARWRRVDGTERERLFAVGVDPAEGRLERLDRERLDRMFASVPVRYDRAASLAAGVDGGAAASLAWPLLVAAVLLLLAEQAVACAAGYHPAFRRGG
ncbi:MAG: BatA domain-containing protein [Pirellulales bacterium]